MSNLSVVVGEARDWDEFIASAPGATHFHRFGWLRTVAEVLGHEALPLAARVPDGTVVGLLPLVRVRTVLFGHYLVSMPFVNYGGPVGSPEATRALAMRAVELAREGGAKLLELRSAVELPLDLPASHRKITVVLDLPAESEQLWKTLPAKVRSQIRRPQKDGVVVRSGLDQLAAFYRVFAEHMRDLGTPVLPRRWFETLAGEFADSMSCAVAWLGETPVAGGVGFRWGSEFEMTWASALTRYQRSAPNMLLYWHCMTEAIEAGCRIFNFGRCTPGGGTHRFKRQWGGRDVQLWWYQDSPHGVAATPTPNRGALALGPKLWRYLPVSVATMLGPRIVRGIP